MGIACLHVMFQFIACGCSVHTYQYVLFLTIDTLDDDDEVLWALAEQVKALVLAFGISLLLCLV